MAYGTNDHSVVKDNLLSPQPTLVPGVADALQARMAARSGFEFLYVSGAATSAVLGFPDMGVIDLGDLVAATRTITDASGLSAVVDFDAGYGNLHVIRRGARDLYRSGAAALQIEDQPVDRRCGYLRSDACVSPAEMINRLDAARQGAPDAVIIARTDALLIDGFEEALDRVSAYAEAGADLLLVNGIRTLEELGTLCSTVNKPVVYNVSGSDRSPYIGKDEASSIGVAVVLYPIQVARAAAMAASAYLRGLESGSPPDVALIEFGEFMDLAGWSEAAEFEDAFPPT
ncbi:MAG TPA: isocitrate lyase/PEP mutase family protein [Acidimicrobiia bacterium]|nr:isocitrate lyase/PEP mutase family protein [Acidimicrobiia bacterium]